MLLFQRLSVATEPELMQAVCNNLKGACKSLVIAVKIYGYSLSSMLVFILFLANCNTEKCPVFV